MRLSRISGEPVGKVLSRLLRMYPESPAKPRPGRFPTFEVPADAPMISAERVQRILDEEG